MKNISHCFDREYKICYTYTRGYMGTVRQPQKTNSIEKKSRIIKASLKIFGEKGYYNTNTAQIAKVAGVSTGIVYSYFKDKKDILLQALQLYFRNIFSPIKLFLDNLTKLNKQTIHEFLKVAIKSHKDNFMLHEEVIALSHLDPDVHNEFLEFELEVNEKILKVLDRHNLKFSDKTEKVHLAYNLVENLCHEYVYHRHSNIDYYKMIDLTTQTLLLLFK